MTYNPPSGPPPGDPNAGRQPGGFPPPGGYGQQQPGQYQPPPPPSQPPQQQWGPAHHQQGQWGQQPGAARSGFNAGSVHPLDWAIMAAGLLTLIFSFFGYYHYGPKGPANKACDQINDAPASLRGPFQDFCDGVTTSAWHGFFGWFGVLLAVIGAVVVAIAIFAPSVKLPAAARLIAAGAFALALIVTLIAIAVVPNNDLGLGIPSDSYDKGVDEGLGFSYWIVLILILAGLALSVLRAQQTGTNLGSLFSPGSKTQSSGVYGPPPTAGGGHQQGYQQPGYQPQPPPQQQAYPQQAQQPPPQQSYQPQPPPGGYQPQPPPGGYQPPAGGYQPPPPPPTDPRGDVQ